MDDPRPAHLARKLERYAGQHVPPTVDLWPAVRRALLTPARRSGIFNSGGGDFPPDLYTLRRDRAQPKENAAMSLEYDYDDPSVEEAPSDALNGPARRRRPPTVAKIHVEPAPSESIAEPVARSNMPVILGIVGVGGVIALLLVAMIFNNLSQKSGATAGSASVPVATGPEDVVPGSLAVDFSATELMTGQVVHVSDYRGKNPVWLNFWASWCGPCKQEMPDMEQLYQLNKAKGLVILGFDVREDQKTVSDFVTSRGFTWTFLLQPNGETANRYYVSGIPTHVFIGKDGVIKSRISSGLPRAYMEAELAKILQ